MTPERIFFLTTKLWPLQTVSVFGVWYIKNGVVSIIDTHFLMHAYIFCKKNENDRMFRGKNSKFVKIPYNMYTLTRSINFLKNNGRKMPNSLICTMYLNRVHFKMKVNTVEHFENSHNDRILQNLSQIHFETQYKTYQISKIVK